MIEAAEYATSHQMYDRYAEIHRKFFPKPPSVAAIIKNPPTETESPPPELPVIASDNTRERTAIIRRNVIQSFGITKDMFMAQRRLPDIVLARHVYCYLCMRLTQTNFSVLGRSLKRDHTTVMHSIRAMEAKLAIDGDLAERVQMIETRIRLEFGEHDRPRRFVGRYVQHHQVMDYMLVGWMWAANLNEYAALMIWPCSCLCVEPRG